MHYRSPSYIRSREADSALARKRTSLGRACYPRDVAGPNLSGKILDRRYEVGERISEGAMGVVYRAMRIKLERPVAIKVLHVSLPPEMKARERFEREVQLMARLDHPHCVSIIDHGIYDQKPYVVMELVRGQSLHEVLAEQGRFEIPRAIDIMTQVLSGLSHAHEQGIIHRDIKPANIMVTPKAPLGLHVRILDFGLARMLDEDASLSDGVAVGTPSYMAPEQCRGEPVDASVDIYACGIVLFEMLTGKKPLTDDDPLVTVRKQIDERPPRLADIAPGEYGQLEQIVARALEKKPADRFRSAAAMSEALGAVLRGRAAPESTLVLPKAAPQIEAEPSSEMIPITLASSVSVKRPTAPRSRSSPLAIVFALAAVAGAGALLVHELSDMRESGTSRVSEGRAAAESTPVVAAPARSTPVVSAPASASAPATSTPVGSAPAPSTPVGSAPPTASGPPAIAEAPPPGTDGSAAALHPPNANAASGVAGTADPVTGIVVAANQLASAGKLDRALDVVVAGRALYRDRPELPLLAGKLYFSKYWWVEGIASFREAIKLDPALATDHDLCEVAVNGFMTTPEWDGRLSSFVLELGPGALPALEAVAQSPRSPASRARAADLAKRIQAKPR